MSTRRTGSRRAYQSPTTEDRPRPGSICKLRGYTFDFFREHAALGTSDETPLFVLGMPRSGTTLIEQILSSHPLVAAGGEMMFSLKRGIDWEQRAPNGLSSTAIVELAEAYRAELRQIAPDAARVTNKMPHNYLWIGLIHLVFPRARIIHAGGIR